MADPPVDPIDVLAAARVRETATRQCGIVWPFAVDQRLNQLVALANGASANTYRNEVAAALVAASLADPAELRRLVDSYRLVTVGEVILGVQPEQTRVSIARRGPGRPPLLGQGELGDVGSTDAQEAGSN